MSPSEAIGYLLNNTSSITNIVGTRINFGNRPTTETLPAINYYTLSNSNIKYTYYSEAYTINCRSVSPEVCCELARLVSDLFNGSSGTGTYGDSNGFGITRAFTRQIQGLIPEPDNGSYNVPVDIQIVFSNNAIS